MAQNIAGIYQHLEATDGELSALQKTRELCWSSTQVGFRYLDCSGVVHYLLARPDHNLLSNLNTGELKHLTSAEYNNLHVPATGIGCVKVDAATQEITLDLGTTLEIAGGKLGVKAGAIAHSSLTGIGVNNHIQIDTHISDSSVHFTKGSISHTEISDRGTHTHAQLDSHLLDGTIHHSHTNKSTIDAISSTDVSNWNYINTLKALTLLTSSDKDVANGVCGLDANGKVPTNRLYISGGMSYKGTWNASTNTPNLSLLTPNSGDYYVVSTSGSTSLGGITDWVGGDWAIYNGTSWSKVDNTESFTSINGQTSGVVTINSSNLSIVTSGYTGVLSGVTATLQAALSMIDTHGHTVAKISDFTSAVTSHTEVASSTAARHTHTNKATLDAITSTNTANWTSAYGWGNHANAGYLTSLYYSKGAAKALNTSDGSNKWQDSGLTADSTGIMNTGVKLALSSGDLAIWRDIVPVFQSTAIQTEMRAPGGTARIYIDDTVATSTVNLVVPTGTSGTHAVNKGQMDTAINAKESALGNPASDGMVLSSTTAGVRSWITPAAGGGVTWIAAPVDPDVTTNYPDHTKIYKFSVSGSNPSSRLPASYGTCVVSKEDASTKLIRYFHGDGNSSAGLNKTWISYYHNSYGWTAWTEVNDMWTIDTTNAIVGLAGNNSVLLKDNKFIRWGTGLGNSTFSVTGAGGILGSNEVDIYTPHATSAINISQGQYYNAAWKAGTTAKTSRVELAAGIINFYLNTATTLDAAITPTKVLLIQNTEMKLNSTVTSPTGGFTIGNVSKTWAVTHIDMTYNSVYGSVATWDALYLMSNAYVYTGPIIRRSAAASSSYVKLATTAIDFFVDNYSSGAVDTQVTTFVNAMRIINNEVQVNPASGTVAFVVKAPTFEALRVTNSGKLYLNAADATATVNSVIPHLSLVATDSNVVHLKSPNEVLNEYYSIAYHATNIGGVNLHVRGKAGDASEYSVGTLSFKTAAGAAATANTSSSFEVAVNNAGTLTTRLGINNLGYVSLSGAAYTERLNVGGAVLLGAAVGTSDGTIQYASNKFQFRENGAWKDFSTLGGVSYSYARFSKSGTLSGTPVIPYEGGDTGTYVKELLFPVFENITITDVFVTCNEYTSTATNMSFVVRLASYSQGQATYAQYNSGTQISTHTCAGSAVADWNKYYKQWSFNGLTNVVTAGNSVMCSITTNSLSGSDAIKDLQIFVKYKRN